MPPGGDEVSHESFILGLLMTKSTGSLKAKLHKNEREVYARCRGPSLARTLRVTCSLELELKVSNVMPRILESLCLTISFKGEHQNRTL